VANPLTPAQADSIAPAHGLWIVLGGLSIFFHLGLIFYGLVPNLIARPIHMALALPWVLVFASAPVDSLQSIPA